MSGSVAAKAAILLASASSGPAPWAIVLLCLVGLLLLFILVLLIRAALFRPEPMTAGEREEVEVDLQSALGILSEMVKIPTVSSLDKSAEDPLTFKAFRELLRSSFPLVNESCTLEQIGEGGVLYKLEGAVHEAPTVFMAHYDVVPAEAESWKRPPFSGILEDGELWGRGTLDTKGTLCAALFAAETLLAGGFTPARDMYFAFSSGEEISGDDAPLIVDYLEERGVRPALVLDEGGAVVDGLFPGISAPAAVIGLAEKGILNVTFRAKSAGGHASAPPGRTPVGALGRAITRVAKDPFPSSLTPPAALLFDTLGRHSGFVYRLIFANLGIFFPVLNHICKKSGGELNALIRTTCVFTKMKGSEAYNVIPSTAEISANLRILAPGTIASTIERLRSTVADDTIEIEEVYGNEPSTVSRTDTEGYARVADAIRATWPGVIVSPYLMFAGSDSRHYHRICDCVLRFSAMYLSKEDRGLIHGHDERIREKQFAEAIEFYIRLMREL